MDKDNNVVAFPKGKTPAEDTPSSAGPITARVISREAEFKKPHLLVVEQEGALQRALKRYLERKGFRVTTCHELSGVKENSRYAGVVIGDESARPIADFGGTPGALEAVPAMRFIRERKPERLPVIVLTDNMQLIHKGHSGLMGPPNFEQAIFLPRDMFERGREVSDMSGEVLLDQALHALSLLPEAPQVASAPSR